MSTAIDKYINIGYERGYKQTFEQAFQQGFKQGFEQEILRDIKAVIENLHLSAEEAMTALNIPVEERDKYRAKLH